MRSFLLLLLALALPVSDARAQTSLTDGVVDQVLRAALEHIDRAKCGAAKCAPATELERAHLPLTTDETRMIIRWGLTAAFAETCGINWRDRSFIPMMEYWRHGQNKNERQMALIGLVHGIAMSMVDEKECSAQQKEKWEKSIDFSPNRFNIAS